MQQKNGNDGDGAILYGGTPKNLKYKGGTQ